MSLSEFVREILRKKGLNPNDVHKRSRRQISAGYVSDIINEKTVNPTVSKLKALAAGLGESEENVFRVARGLPLEKTENQTHIEIIQKFERLSPQRQSEAIKMLDLLGDFDQRETQEEIRKEPKKISSTTPLKARPSRQALNEALDLAMGIDGKELSPKDRETIRKALLEEGIGEGEITHALDSAHANGGEELKALFSKDDEETPNE